MHVGQGQWLATAAAQRKGQQASGGRVHTVLPNLGTVPGFVQVQVFFFEPDNE